MVIFRNFLYLDTNMLDDYLATLQGYVADGAIDQLEVEKKGKGGKAGYKIVEGEVTSEQSTETKRTLAVTDAAKFQQLYDLMEQDDLFIYLDLFDSETWNKIRRKYIIEAEVSLRLPDAFALLQTVNELSPMLELAKMFGEDPLSDPEAKVAFEGLSNIVQLMENKPIPLVGESLGTPGYKFACLLPRKFIRCELDDLQGEATLFGKVKRVIAKGTKHDLFSLLPAFDVALPSISKQKQMSIQRDMAEKGLAEIVHGPALLITPLAIYQ